jgi:hypothetical protein
MWKGVGPHRRVRGVAKGGAPLMRGGPTLMAESVG